MVGYPAYHFAFLKELQLSDTAVAVSKSPKHEILSEKGGEYEEKIRRIHNGIDLKLLIKSMKRLEQELQNPKKQYYLRAR